MAILPGKGQWQDQVTKLCAWNILLTPELIGIFGPVSFQSNPHQQLFIHMVLFAVLNISYFPVMVFGSALVKQTL